MGFSDEQKKQLNAPLAREYVSTRSERGDRLSYVEGHHVIREMNRVFGFDGWHRETVRLECLGDFKSAKGTPGVAYIAVVRLTVSTPDGDFGTSAITREGSGYGSGYGKNLVEAHESAFKEAETDAMKRAAITFGDPFGLALYDKAQSRVVDDNSGPTLQDAIEGIPVGADKDTIAAYYRDASRSLTKRDRAALGEACKVALEHIGG